MAMFAWPPKISLKKDIKVGLLSCSVRGKRSNGNLVVNYILQQENGGREDKRTQFPCTCARNTECCQKVQTLFLNIQSSDCAGVLSLKNTKSIRRI